MWWLAIFWTVVGIVGAVAFSLALAYLLKSQRLHWQIHVLRQFVKRTRSPWQHEDEAWRHLGRAVEQIPEDLIAREDK